jgi:hypothetical protein
MTASTGTSDLRERSTNSSATDATKAMNAPRDWVRTNIGTVTSIASAGSPMT